MSQPKRPRISNATRARIPFQSQDLIETIPSARGQTPRPTPSTRRPGWDWSRELSKISRSILVGRDDLAVVDRGQGIPGQVADRVLDEPDRAVAQNHVHPAGVVGAGRDHVAEAAPVAMDARPPVR